MLRFNSLMAHCKVVDSVIELSEKFGWPIVRWQYGRIRRQLAAVQTDNAKSIKSESYREISEAHSLLSSPSAHVLFRRRDTSDILQLKASAIMKSDNYIVSRPKTS